MDHAKEYLWNGGETAGETIHTMQGRKKISDEFFLLLQITQPVVVTVVTFIVNHIICELRTKIIIRSAIIEIEHICAHHQVATVIRIRCLLVFVISNSHYSVVVALANADISCSHKMLVGQTLVVVILPHVLLYEIFEQDIVFGVVLKILGCIRRSAAESYHSHGIHTLGLRESVVLLIHMRIVGA